MDKTGLALIVAIVGVLTSACDLPSADSSVSPHDQGVPADYCVAIAAPESATDALVGRFDEFAKSLKLSIDSSSPVQREYVDVSERAEISIRLDFGDHGSVVALFRFDASKGLGLRDSLQSFVEKEFASTYDVTPCSEIFDEPPMIFRK